MIKIPVLQLSMLDSGIEDKNTFISKLRDAVHNIGFFYIIDHGVSTSFLERVQQITNDFFKLSEEDKLSISMINSPHFRGYNRAGNELTNGKQDWREQFDIGAEREPHKLTKDSPIWMGLHGHNQWPDALPELKDVMLKYNNVLTDISLKLLRALSLVLNLPEDAFDDIYGNTPNEHMKLIKYPGCKSPEKIQGVGAHKDSGILTFILQDENKGLQVEVRKNKWIDALPIKNSFVVNLGELLELASNGYLRATVHRVLPPEQLNERISIAYFLGASLDSVVPVFKLPEELTIDTNLIDTDPNNPLLRDVGLNYMKGRLRSHPDVAKKFYNEWSNSA